ncbi:MAG: hypothetical protein Q9160_000017 [Pyrenula sp. 1 TL-2023]
MGTIILGGGIIGFSTAYYLSLSQSSSPSSQEPSRITILDSSPTLFASASGYAAGFLARDWFGPALSSLGALSFDLHEELASEHDGRRRWGYSRSTALSLAVQDDEDGVGVGKGRRGEDWLFEGGSRAEVVAGGAKEEVISEDGSPRWLTKQKGGSLEVIGEEGSCAQVDPSRLCEFLREKCKENGVIIKAGRGAVSVTKNEDSAIDGLMVRSVEGKNNEEETRLPCSSIVLAAGAWTPSIFRELFPQSKLSIPISPLAGHSLVLKSPRHKIDNEEQYGRCHAIFAAPSRSIGFSPEIFSRVGGEIYIAGLNDAGLALPKLATGAKIETDSIQDLKRAAGRLLGEAKEAAGESGAHDDDLEIVREGLCFRPAGRGGRPVIARVSDDKFGGRLKAKDGSGVFVAAGHGPWGITLSLGTGLVVAEMVQGKKTSAQTRGLGF